MTEQPRPWYAKLMPWFDRVRPSGSPRIIIDDATLWKQASEIFYSVGLSGSFASLCYRLLRTEQAQLSGLPPGVVDTISAMAASNAALTNEVAALKSELEKFKEEVRVAARLYDEQDYYILVNRASRAYEQSRAREQAETTRKAQEEANALARARSNPK